ncbi:MAG TPA: undecaprenyl-diphosphate phosphatase [Spirochaetia bacterium]|nr:undecaprenyl-diphosphate phosphatase [Spirochaetia bacterium]
MNITPGKTLVLILLLVLLLAVGAVPLFADDAPAFRAGTSEPLRRPASAMSIPQALVLGIVEGVTEFLPVSSTGHLTVVQGLLGLWATPEEKDASDAYAICIQAGAILAVLLVSFGRIRAMVRGIFGQDRDGLRLFGNVVVAFIPAAVFGLLLEKTIKHYLYGVWPVAAAWLVGGLFILLVLVRVRRSGGAGLEGLTWRWALIIGCAQVLALWPGVSRSLVTIAAGMLLGLSVGAAVEFSFLLGLVTLGAATVYEALKLGSVIVRSFGWISPLLGLIAAAVSAFVAVRWMIEYLRTRSLAIFGWYRIAIAVAAGVLVLTGVI